MNRPSLREQLTRAARKSSDPVYLQDFFLATGHTDSTRNATATFVRRNGHTYACTCRHVLTQSTDSSVVGPGTTHPTLALTADQLVINLSSFVATGLVPALKAPEPQFCEAELDISIACIDHVWTAFSRKKDKEPIDLDNWSEPPWSMIEKCIAFGYFDEPKALIGGVVHTPMGEVAADVATELSGDRRTFALSSRLEEPTNYSFSGISGGPVFGLWGESEASAQFAPIGIVFEGSPGSSRTKSSPDAYLSSNDIFIRGITLTPETFSGWLDRCAI